MKNHSGTIVVDSISPDFSFSYKATLKRNQYNFITVVLS
eukprot:COSAG02_NODE_2341_length_9104_cov_2.666185_2_plen_39_part_00